MFITFVALIIAHQFTSVQQTTARLTASLYLTAKYMDRDLTFYSIEYSPQFGTYWVSYQDPNNKVFAVEVKSKRMPIIIGHDPLDSGP